MLFPHLQGNSSEYKLHGAEPVTSFTRLRKYYQASGEKKRRSIIIPASVFEATYQAVSIPYSWKSMPSFSSGGLLRLSPNRQGSERREWGTWCLSVEKMRESIWVWKLYAPSPDNQYMPGEQEAPAVPPFYYYPLWDYFWKGTQDESWHGDRTSMPGCSGKWSPPPHPKNSPTTFPSHSPCRHFPQNIFPMKNFLIQKKEKPGRRRYSGEITSSLHACGLARHIGRDGSGHIRKGEISCFLLLCQPKVNIPCWMGGRLKTFRFYNQVAQFVTIILISWRWAS